MHRGDRLVRTAVEMKSGNDRPSNDQKLEEASKILP